MARYELVREIPNLCANNQMRDVFFDEVETDDPVAYVRGQVRGKDVRLSVETKENGELTIFVESAGMTQKFLFTPA